MTLTINVPDSMTEQVSAWEDGMDYEVKIKQTGSGQFDLVESESETSEDESAATPETIEGAAAMFNEGD